MKIVLKNIIVFFVFFTMNTLYGLAQPPIQKFWALNQNHCLLPNGMIGNPVAAFSLRRICCNYAGPAIRVLRNSDNTSMDIGFTSRGDLDTTTLLNWVQNITSASSVSYTNSTYNSSFTITVPNAVSISSVTLTSGTMSSNGYTAYASSTTVSNNQTVIVGYSYSTGYWPFTSTVTRMVQATFTFSGNTITVQQSNPEYISGNYTTNNNLTTGYNNGASAGSFGTTNSTYSINAITLTVNGIFKGSGYVTTWYDQSGNSNHLVYNNTNNSSLTMPRIVGNSIVDRKGNNNRPAVTFWATTDELQCATQINAQVVNAVRDLIGSSYQYLISMPIDVDFSVRANGGYAPPSGGYSDPNGNNTGPNGNDWWYTYNTNNGYMYVNGSQISGNSSGAVSTLHTLVSIAALANYGGGNAGPSSYAYTGNRTFSMSSQFDSRGMYNGDGVCELLIFPDNTTLNATSATGRNALQKNQKAYYGTTP